MKRLEQRTYTMKDASFWKITCSLALASFFIFAGLYAVQPLLPVFVETFDISVSISSLSISLTIFGLIAGLVVLGFLSDRHGRTVFIRWSLVGSIIPFIVIPVTNSFPILLFLRLLQGFAMAGLPAGALAYLNEEIDKKSVGTATALYISSNALGGMAGRVFAGYLTDYYSWETAFYTLAGLGLLILAAVFLLLPASRFFQPSKLTFSRDISAFSYHLKNPALLLVFGLGVVLQLSFTGVWTYLPFHLQAAPYSLPLQTISNMFMAYGLGVIGSPLAGWLSGKLGLRRIRILGIVTLTIGLFLTLSHSVVVIVVGLCIACLGFFTAHSLTAASVTEQAIHHKGSASSLYLVSYYLGVSFGSSALSPLWTKTGWTGLVLVTSILPVLYVVFITIMQRWLRRQANTNRG